MPRCPSCNARVSANDRECPECEAPLKGGKKKGKKKSGPNVVLIVVAVVAGLGLLGICVVVGLVAMAIPAARATARMVQSKQNLRQIGLAVHTYHDAHGALPSGSTQLATGEPGHSWMTSLLPFLEYESLAPAIDPASPWNSPRNQQAFKTRVHLYLNPNIQEQTSTDGYALSHYAGNSQVLLKNGSMKLPDVSDGTSNTMLGGEVSQGFKPWGSPENLRDPAAGLGGGPDSFGGPASTTVILLLDGSVKNVAKTVDPQTLRALATPKGGDVVGEF